MGVVSIPHLAMKFPLALGDILTIHGDQKLDRECYIASLRPQEPILAANNVERPPKAGVNLVIDDLGPIVGSDSIIEPIRDTRSLVLTLGRNLKVGSGLKLEEEVMTKTTLKDNTNIFAWSEADLPRVDP